jgi:Protein of unknown function (DUF3014)
MKKRNVMTAIGSVVLLAVAAGGYFYWQYSQPRPVSVPVMPAPPPPPAPPPQPVQQVIEAPPAPPRLPRLSESDSFMLDTIAGLVNNRTLMKLFNTERIIHNIVATIDNLPRKRAPYSVMPLKRVHGLFITEGQEDNLAISAKNAMRYRAYARVAEVIDAKKLVEVYVRLYPLFQQAYEELGYPKKYFNDRLVFVIDHLLAAPEPAEPIRLVQPRVLYQFADPDLESRSAGQKILMRIGSKNEATVKAKLREIKQELLLHMHDKKVEGAEAPASPAEQPEQQ